MNIGILKMIVLRFSIHGEIIIERTNGRCHAFSNLVCKRKIFLRISMSRVNFVRLSQL